jgi:two-component system, cell cycle response regulator
MAKEDKSTKIITDIHEILSSSEKEAQTLPAGLVVIGGDFNGTLFDLIEGNEVVVGRSAENQIPLDIEGISRKHCKFSSNDGKFFIEDLGSKNGTYVNNNKITIPFELNKGDIIKIGTIVFKFIPKGDAERLSYDKLKYEASIDKWTGAYNKVYFIRALDFEVQKSKITGDDLSLIVMDIDFFKKINDEYGHDAGDFVLKELSNIIRNSGIRKTDVFARYGGEEFVILFPNADLETTLAIAERIRAHVEKHSFLYQSEKIPVTLSIGVSDNKSEVVTPIDLFKKADEAVYTAKRSGRNRVCSYKDKRLKAA